MTRSLWMVLFVAGMAWPAWAGAAGAVTGGGAETLSVRLKVVHSERRQPLTYRGEFEIDGRTLKVHLIDGDRNDHVGDMLDEITFCRNCKVSHDRADQIVVNTDGSNNHRDRLPLARWLVLGDTLFETELQSDEDELILMLKRSDQATSLVVPESVARLAVIGEDGQGGVSMFDPAGRVPAPPGRYRLYSYMLQANDAEGDVWRLSASGVEETPTLESKEAVHEPIELGEPFMTGVDVVVREQPRFFRRPDISARLSFVIAGRGGERVTNIVRDGGRRPKEPTWQAVTGEGERVAGGSFEYG